MDKIQILLLVYISAMRKEKARTVVLSARIEKEESREKPSTLQSMIQRCTIEGSEVEKAARKRINLYLELDLMILHRRRVGRLIVLVSYRRYRRLSAAETNHCQTFRRRQGWRDFRPERSYHQRLSNTWSGNLCR